jgi:N6-adenosine-specific RNA methylase IME4
VGDLRPAEAYRQMKKDEVADKVAALPDDIFSVIYADPPWKYGDGRTGDRMTATGAEHHYPTMSLEELKALGVPSLVADDSVLFLWATSPLLPDGLELAKAWGFTYKGAFIWDKVKHNLGHYNSVRHEFLLICTRGSCTPEHTQLFDSVQSIERAEHSVKPEEFRRIIETLYPSGRKIELFRRGDTPEGWAAWGNEHAA